MKRFHIQEETAGYRPEPGVLPDPALYDACPSLPAQDEEQFWQLYFLPEAIDQLCRHVEWGADTPRNRVEQGGLLFGNVYSAQGIYFGIVRAVIPGQASRADATSMRLDAAAWSGMVNEAARVAPAGSVVVGWYHTHPGSLSAFFSDVDRQTQSVHFDKDWMFAVVLQPQRCEWAVWHGGNARPCPGWWLYPKGSAAAAPRGIDVRVEIAPNAAALTLADWQFVGEAAQAVLDAPGTAPPRLLVCKRPDGALHLDGYDRHRAVVAYLVNNNIPIRASVQGGDSNRRT